jgi:hypothetical protein
VQPERSDHHARGHRDRSLAGPRPGNCRRAGRGRLGDRDRRPPPRAPRGGGRPASAHRRRGSGRPRRRHRGRAPCGVGGGRRGDGRVEPPGQQRRGSRAVAAAPGGAPGAGRARPPVRRQRAGTAGPRAAVLADARPRERRDGGRDLRRGRAAVRRLGRLRGHQSGTRAAPQRARGRSASVRVYRFDPGDMRTKVHQDAFPGEDISGRPAPEEAAAALWRLLEVAPPSGRYRAAQFAGATA